jgi:hypothetical protein
MLRLASLAAALALITEPGWAEAPGRAAPFAPSWTCSARGLTRALPPRAASRRLTFSFSAATHDLAALGARRSCKSAYPQRTRPGSCVIIACHATR